MGSFELGTVDAEAEAVVAEVENTSSERCWDAATEAAGVTSVIAIAYPYSELKFG